MFVPGFQPLGFQPLGFQAGEWADESGVVVVPVDDDGSAVWEREKRRKRRAREALAAKPVETFDKWREAAARELAALEYDDDALALLLMAA